MIDNNFYNTINSLVTSFNGLHTYYNPATQQTVNTMKPITDWDSFVDAGKVLADMEIQDLVNGFLTPLMNRITTYIDTVRAYEPALMDMYEGTDKGGVVQIITHKFYQVRQAPFINMTPTENDDSFTYAPPEVEARYYTEEVAWQLPISITTTQLRAAWENPQQMDAFIAGLLLDAANSNRLRREVARMNTLASRISDVYANGTNVNAYNGAGQCVNLVTIWNSIHPEGEQLDSNNALENINFTRWAVGVINMYMRKIEKANTKFNGAGLEVFTPKFDQRVKINDVFQNAMDLAYTSGIANEKATIDSTYEILPYWQMDTYPDRVSAVRGDKAGVNDDVTDADLSGRVIACLFDRYALMEFVNLEDVTSNFNAKKKYTTYYYNYIMRYVSNENANFVMFTLD